MQKILNDEWVDKAGIQQVFFGFNAFSRFDDFKTCIL